jgi:hypothetical protein
MNAFNPQLEIWKNQFTGNQQQHTFSQYQGIQRSVSLKKYLYYDYDFIF